MPDRGEPAGMTRLSRTSRVRARGDVLKTPDAN
jgi:hypothetical protein